MNRLNQTFKNNQIIDGKMKDTFLYSLVYFSYNPFMYLTCLSIFGSSFAAILSANSDETEAFRSACARAVQWLELATDAALDAPTHLGPGGDKIV